MIDIKLTDKTITIAKVLLIQAGVGPNFPNPSDEGDQYSISYFGVDVNSIKITNNGVDHYLTTVRQIK